jgi:hypothetical protein
MNYITSFQYNLGRDADESRARDLPF